MNESFGKQVVFDARNAFLGAESTGIQALEPRRPHGFPEFLVISACWPSGSRAFDLQNPERCIRTCTPMAQLNLLFDNARVVKGNPLVEASYDWSTQMHRIIMMMVSQLRRDDSEFGLQRVYVRDIIDLCELSSNSIYGEVDLAADALLNQRIKIRAGEGTWHGYNILSSVHVYKHRGYIEAMFNPQMRPFLLQLKSRFTQYRLRQAMQLGSPYSIRFYELCSRWADVGHFQLSIEDLRAMFMLQDKYDRVSDLCRWVIDAARNELEQKCDLYFTYKREKNGRSIRGFHFTIREKTGAAPAPDASTSDVPARSADVDAELLDFELFYERLTAEEQQSLREEAYEHLRRQIPGLEDWKDVVREAMVRDQMVQFWHERRARSAGPADALSVPAGPAPAEKP